MNNEKLLLTTIFLLFFVLSGVLMSVMIKKDLRKEEILKKSFQESVRNDKPENSWPKVEIEVRK